MDAALDEGRERGDREGIFPASPSRKSLSPPSLLPEGGAGEETQNRKKGEEKRRREVRQGTISATKVKGAICTTQEDICLQSLFN